MSDTSVALKGTVNPHGLKTDYYFQYGLTVAWRADADRVAVGSATTGFG